MADTKYTVKIPRLSFRILRPLTGIPTRTGHTALRADRDFRGLFRSMKGFPAKKQYGLKRVCFWTTSHVLKLTNIGIGRLAKEFRAQKNDV